MESEELSPEQPVAREDDAPAAPSNGTTPPDDTKDATTPPGNPAPDEDAVRRAKDKLEHAGGGS